MGVQDAAVAEKLFPGRFIDYFDARLFVPKGHFDEAHLLVGGKPEVHVIRAFERFVNPGNVVLDIGANIGTHAFALASLVGDAGKVYAVEADVDNITYLRASIVESASTNIVLLPLGASDQPCLLRACETVNTNTLYTKNADNTILKVVGAFALDALIDERVEVVKLDIEGAELLALQGLIETIDRSRPVVLSEFSPAYIKKALGTDRSRDFFDYFNDRDYSCFHLDHTGSMHHKLDYEELIAAHKAGFELFSWCHLDLVFVPSERPMQERRLPPRTKRNYAIPAFLLRKPTAPEIPWCFAEPCLAKTVCQLCTNEQMESPEYEALAQSLGLDPLAKQRKAWEFAFILATLRQRGRLAPGRRGLGFGTGREPLPSCFAAAGVRVVATDAPLDLANCGLWTQSQQWTQDIASLWIPNLVCHEDFRQRVTHRAVDMNTIPDDLRGFDFCWSACCLEHLGSIRHGLDFIKNSLATLRPGGVAVHTTEFNIGSEVETFETPDLVLFRKVDIETLIRELIAEGHEVEPLNLWPGATQIDEHIDIPPFSDVHLKLEIAHHVTTSIGLIVTKRCDVA